MNLLVIGNGFDLAHGMPTRYIDFLYFMGLLINKMPKLYSGYLTENYYEELDSTNVKECLRKYRHAFPSSANNISEIFKVSFNNIQVNKTLINAINENDWLKYFFFIYRVLVSEKNNWIDFESELSKALIYINNNFTMETLKSGMPISRDKIKLVIGGYHRLSHKTVNFYNFITKNHIDKNTLCDEPECIDFLRKELFNYLYNQLILFSQILRIYLSIIENQKIIPFTPIFNLNNKHFLLSFNYTQTIFNLYPKIYKNLYGSDFINGKISNTDTSQCNIILGIDSSKIKNIDTFCDNNMYKFFKYAQRAIFDFSQGLPLWLNGIYDYADPDVPFYIEDLNLDDELYTDIIGHSLDVTDKHILYKVITHSDYVRIFYFNEADRINKIKNLIKILGQSLFQKIINNPINRPHIQLIDQNEIMINPIKKDKE